ncbi:MAG: hypothetical protein QM811_02205 [Pirellulales bacterium]
MTALGFCIVFCSVIVARADEPQAKAPAKPEALVTIVPGTLPIVLSAPHGGRTPIPGTEPRVGKNVDRFVTALDGNVDRVAELTADALEKRLGGRPYVVIARFDAQIRRRESRTGRGLRKRSRQASLRCLPSRHSRRVGRDQARLGPRPAGRYSRAGEIAGGDLSRYGRRRVGHAVGQGTRCAAVTGSNGVFGVFAKQGYTVFPAVDAEDQTETFYNGGHIVRSYGSDKIPEIDAIQIEYGGEFRKKDRLEKTAAELAEAIERFSKAYLPAKPLQAK